MIEDRRYLAKRTRLLKALRDAQVAYLWHCNIITPQGRRAATLAAKRLMERSRELWKLQRRT